MAAKNDSLRHIFLVMRYCEDVVSCRKELQLAHLGEKFERAWCQNMCDNCLAPKTYTDQDCTAQALQLARFIARLTDAKETCTLTQLIDIL